MSNIRIGQQLAVGYNPDGTPGTVTTGVPGPPGPGPTDAQVVAAVSTYLQTHPVSGVAGGTAGFKKLSTGIVTNDADFSAFGVGVDGSGSWVGIGTYGSTVDGYVIVDGTTTNADLHLKAKGPKGRLWVNAPITTAQSSITLDSDVTITGNLIMGDNGLNADSVLNVGAIVAGSAASNAGPLSQIMTLRAGNSYFGLDSTGGWALSDEWVAMTPYGSGHGEPGDGVKIFEPSTGNYLALTCSSLTQTSDRRLKSDIVELSGALEEVRTTPAYGYVMSGQQRRGLIADEAPAVALRTDENGLQHLDLYDLVGTLWAAVRELADTIKGMEQTCRCQPIR